MVRVSLTDGLDASKSIPDVKSILNQLIDAEAGGFEINADDDAISISSTIGLGRLDGDFMASWNENSSVLLDGGSAMEVLQVPLVQIQQVMKILSLPDDRINEIIIAEDGDWYVSGGAVSYQNDRGGESHGWEVPDGGLIYDVTLMNNSLLVAHSDGLVEIPDRKDGDLIHHIEGEEIQLAAILSQNLPDLPSTIFSMDYLDNSGEDWLAVKHLTGSDVPFHTKSIEVVKAMVGKSQMVD